MAMFFTSAQAWRTWLATWAKTKPTVELGFFSRRSDAARLALADATSIASEWGYTPGKRRKLDSQRYAVPFARPVVFEGFARDAMGFFHELAAEMNREWYEQNKTRYQELWVEPMTRLFEQVRTALAPIYKGRPIGPPKLFRLHRDVRFGKDKTPYKTHIAGVLPLHANKKPVEGGCTPLYLEIGMEGDWVGAGTYIFDAAQLARWRKLVAAPKTGPVIARLVDGLREAGYEVSSHDPFKRVPRGFDADHPRAELLKMRGLIAGFPEIPRGKIHRADFAEWLVEHATAVAPMVRWLYTNLR